MMRRTRRNGGSMGLGIGGATLIMLFTVLCLTILATMSLVRTKQEWSLAQRSADAVTAYYASDSKATAVYASIRAAERSATLEGAEVDGVMLSERDGTVTYAVSVDEAQALQVALVWSAEYGWEIQSWQVVHVASWDADDALDVWDGE